MLHTITVYCLILGSMLYNEDTSVDLLYNATYNHSTNLSSSSNQNSKLFSRFTVQEFMFLLFLSKLIIQTAA